MSKATSTLPKATATGNGTQNNKLFSDIAIGAFRCDSPQGPRTAPPSPRPSCPPGPQRPSLTRQKYADHRPTLTTAAPPPTPSQRHPSLRTPPLLRRSSPPVVVPRELLQRHEPVLVLVQVGEAGQGVVVVPPEAQVEHRGHVLEHVERPVPVEVVRAEHLRRPGVLHVHHRLGRPRPEGGRRPLRLDVHAGLGGEVLRELLQRHHGLTVGAGGREPLLSLRVGEAEPGVAQRRHELEHVQVPGPLGVVLDEQGLRVLVDVPSQTGLRHVAERFVGLPAQRILHVLPIAGALKLLRGPNLHDVLHKLLLFHNAISILVHHREQRCRLLHVHWDAQLLHRVTELLHTQPASHVRIEGTEHVPGRQLEVAGGGQ
mmetsp:Transcript_24610/g.42187  ORF Transcript_24610/g.42187 Transcript_24610/m.42187 type:complete len:372 (+) Transcript_24610:414-1529(+)